MIATGSKALASRVATREGQAVIALVGSLLAVFAAVAVLAQFGSAMVARGRDQRTADLAATAAASQMSKDFARLFVPGMLPGGAPNPNHLTKAEYRDRAHSAAKESARANGGSERISRVEFTPRPMPTRVTIRTSRDHRVEVAGSSRASRRQVRIRATATAELRFAFADLPNPLAKTAAGGGYSGPLAYRQGKPMRPDVAAAFDRLAAAARRQGLALAIASGFRSDAEQARLYAQRPDPKWVAPPGTSLHRYGTELDLGPPAAYEWLRQNARQFGFIRRYAWEPWHYGSGSNPRDVPAQYERGSFEPPDGSFVGSGGLPQWVPTRYRPMIVTAAQRHNVQPMLLAGQLKAESDFDPSAVSAAGAQGIAQFMPATARSVGLRDPFDPAQAIAAQAKLMATLIARFSSIPKALAAYNAGPGAVERYGGIPPFGETQAYVARILSLIDGAGGVFDDPAFAGLAILPRVALID